MATVLRVRAFPVARPDPGAPAGRRYDPAVPGRTRSVARIAGRVLLGLLAAVLLAGAVLVILAFYAEATFDVEAVTIAILGAALLVFLWARWR